MKHTVQSLVAALLVLVLTSQVTVQDPELIPAVPATQSDTSQTDSSFLVYTFAIMDMIAAPTWRITQEAFEEAYALGADLVILHLNTYGGR
jgi:membrane-bound ClpP family serine protease